MADERGTIEVGKRADFLILEADPLADIRHTRQVERVIHAGAALDPMTILAAAPTR